MLLLFGKNTKATIKSCKQSISLTVITSMRNSYQNPYIRLSSQGQTPTNAPFQPLPYRSSVQEDVRLSFSADLNPLLQQEGEHHWRSFIATLILVIAIVVPQIIRITQPHDYSNSMAIAVSLTGYVLYLLIGCICNDIHEYLRSIQHGEGFENQYNRVRGLIGQFNFSCECYHYQTRYHVRHYQHDGHHHTETYTTQEKVVTHTASQCIVPTKTNDESGAVDRIRSDRNIVFIHFCVNYRFLDDYSRNRIDELFYSFKQRNTSDVHQNFGMDYVIPGLVEKMAFYVGDLGCNYNCWYYIFALIGLLWPYSLWVESKINRFQVKFMKALKM